MAEQPNQPEETAETSSAAVTKNALILYQRPPENTDLNRPPPNWLRRTNAILLPQTAHSKFSTENGPPSVLLASNHPDSVGQVDVVADSKDIKKLLKMPYCSSAISMSVHRVGKTLLIDSLDDPLRYNPKLRAKLQKHTDESRLFPRKKDPAVARHRSMLSKLLYYCLQESALADSKVLSPALEGSVHGALEGTECGRTDMETFRNEAGTPQSGGEGMETLQRGGEGAETPQRVLEAPWKGAERAETTRREAVFHSVQHWASDTTVPSSQQGELPSAEGGGGANTSQGDKSVSPRKRESVVDPGVPVEGNRRGSLPEGASSPGQGDRHGSLPEGATSPGQGDRHGSLPEGASSPGQGDRHGSLLEGASSPGQGDRHGSLPERASSPGHYQSALLRGWCERLGAQQDAERLPPPVDLGGGQLDLPQRRRELVPSKRQQYQVVACQEGEEALTAFPCPIPEPPPPPPFAKDYRWTIADTRMLLGSDLPILSQGGHPAISLRLREKGKPVTVLTGLDYWLDNLMCNVPELMMCFHLDGVVQNYEVIKTEDIPHLDKSCQFNPQEVLEVAHNVLGFLKANCTREGHTYWLCRRTGEEVVKLYDLSSLEEWEEKSGEELCNPFAKSVATLLYRVAKNMLKDSDESINIALVHMLLDNCIELLKQNTSTKMLVSAYYLQALLVITRVELSAGSQGAAPQEAASQEHPQGSTPPGVQSTCGIASSESKYLVVDKLLKPLSFSEAEPTLPLLSFSNDQERARAGLDYIVKALTLLGPEGQWTQWQRTCVSMLLCLSAAAYEALAEVCMSVGRLGRALRYARYSILCGDFSVMSGSGQVPGVQLAERLYSAWMVCGEIHCLSTKLSDNFSSHLEDFQHQNPEDAPIIILASTPSERKAMCTMLQTDLEISLLRSIDCYQLAQEQLVLLAGDTSQQKRKVEEHIGNSLNELGTYYKQLASLMDHHTDIKQVEKLWLSSHDCYQKSLHKFQEAGNTVNQALVYNNLGALMACCARVHGSPDASGQRSEFSQQEKVFYMKAADFYINGKQVLRGRSTCPGVWDQLVMDLSTVYFTMGTVLQNNAPLSTLTPQDVEREVVEVLMKALNHTEALLNTIDKEHSKYVALSAQAGNCHYQLASLYQKSAYGFSSTQSKQRQSKTQAEKHYNKALQFYQPQYHAAEILRTNMEKALLYEQQAQGKQQVKFLRCVLVCLLDTEASLPEKDVDIDGQLLAVLVHRLQTVLKQLVTVLTKKGESPQLLQLLKSMYTSALKPEQHKSTRELVAALKSLYQQAQK